MTGKDTLSRRLSALELAADRGKNMTKEELIEFATVIMNDPDPIYDQPNHHPGALTTIPPRKLAELLLRECK